VPLQCREPLREDRRRFLLVEDEESVRELVRDTLASKGYRVLEAQDGQAGLAAAARHGEKIDLVLTDVVMPGMGGRELVQQLLSLRPGIKVLYFPGTRKMPSSTKGRWRAGSFSCRSLLRCRI